MSPSQIACRCKAQLPSPGVDACFRFIVDVHSRRRANCVRESIVSVSLYILNFILASSPSRNQSRTQSHNFPHVNVILGSGTYRAALASSNKHHVLHGSAMDRVIGLDHIARIVVQQGESSGAKANGNPASLRSDRRRRTS